MDAKMSAKRLEHLRTHVLDDFNLQLVSRAVGNLLTGLGSRPGSLGILENHAHAMSIYSWFDAGNLEESFDWFFTRSMLQLARVREAPSGEVADKYSAFSASSATFLSASASRAELGAAWTELYSRGSASNSLRFISRQIGLILQGKLDEATSEARNADANRGQFSGEALSMDVSTLVRIHRGSDEGLNAGILELCARSSGRLDLEDGYSEGLLNTPAAMYARLAIISGRDVFVDHAMLPMPWVRSGLEGARVFKYPQLTSKVCHDG